MEVQRVQPTFDFKVTLKRGRPSIEVGQHRILARRQFRERVISQLVSTGRVARSIPAPFDFRAGRGAV